eukprot:2583096-Prymnesium_polylepis.1
MACLRARPQQKVRAAPDQKAKFELEQALEVADGKAADVERELSSTQRELTVETGKVADRDREVESMRKQLQSATRELEFRRPGGGRDTRTWAQLPCLSTRALVCAPLLPAGHARRARASAQTPAPRPCSLTCLLAQAARVPRGAQQHQTAARCGDRRVGGGRLDRRRRVVELRN